MLRANDILRQINAHRAQVAVYRALLDTMSNNYLDTDAGAADVALYRTDGAVVAQEHVVAVKDSIEQQIAALESHCSTLEDMVFEEKVTPLTRIAPKKEEKAHGNKRKDHNQTSPK